MYRKKKWIVNQRGLAPLILIFITFLVISTVLLAKSLHTASLNTQVGAQESDRSFDINSLGGSINKLFRNLTGAPDSDQVGPLDRTKLALGDGKYSKSPKKGYIFGCNTKFPSNQGAGAKGFWINQEGGYWDMTTKLYVDGSVSWPNAIWATTEEGSNRKLTGNGLPLHKTGIYPVKESDDAYQYDRNPNSLIEQQVNLSLPKYPSLLGTPECVGGEVGIMLSGIPIFNGFDAEGRDAVAWEVQDGCNGHPQKDGMYHYHGPSNCLTDKTASNEHSALLGYAFDGFGIYGIKGANGIELSTAALDECHGHSHVINWDGKDVEMYHYHMTYDFPYSVGCFRGKNMVSAPKGVSKDQVATPPQQQQAQANTESSGQSQSYYQKDFDYSLVQAPVLNNQLSFTQFQPAPVYSQSEGFYFPVITPAPAPSPTNTSRYNENLNSTTTAGYTAQQADSTTTSTTTHTTSTSASGNETELNIQSKNESKTAPTPVPTAVPCTAKPSGNSNIVNSGSSVTYTYTFPDSSQINAVSFAPRAGIKFSMNGQTSESGQGLNLSLSPAQTTVQFTVLPDQACTSYTVSFAFTNNCGANFSTFVGMGSASSYGAVCQ